MALCNLCSNITLNKLAIYLDGEDAQIGYAHQPTLKALRLSAETCPLCQMLYSPYKKFLLENPQTSDFEAHKHTGIYLLGGEDPCFDLNAPKGLLALHVISHSNLLKNREFKIATYPDDPLAVFGDVAGRLTTLSTDPLRTYTRLCDWIDECTYNHPECAQPSNREAPVMPKRLVFVGSGSQNLNIHETQGKQYSYAALSYCWGKSPNFVTNDQNYEDRKRGFLVHDLPKTLSDTVEICRGVGIDYVWMDALCIVQGNADDWYEESARMHEIYGNAALTIIATHSDDKTGGCFGSWQPSIAPVPLNLKSSNGSVEGTIYICERPGAIYLEVENTATSKRGWCLQERVLARRSVHFTQDQMFWECQTLCQAEDGMIVKVRYRLNNTLASVPMPYMPLREEMSGQIRVTQSWRVLVEDYSKRQLSVGSDKLTAISGIASRISDLTGRSYIAGLWKEDLPAALLWRRFSDIGEFNNKRAESWRAPSWSWASLDGPIKLQPFTTGDIGENCLSIVSVDVIPKNGERPYAEITAGKMEVKGRVWRAWRADSCQQKDISGVKRDHIGDYLIYLESERDQPVGNVMFDDVSKDAPPAEFDCLEVARLMDNQTVFLVLAPTTDDKYLRIGTGEMRIVEELSNSRVQDVSLL